MTHIKSILAISLFSVFSSACTQQTSEQQSAGATDNAVISAPSKYNIDIWPTLDIEVTRDPSVEAKIKAIMQDMTLEQKIAQMIQPEIRDISVEDMRQYGFGSYLNGGGSFPNGNKQATPQEWIQLAEDFYQASVDDSLDGSSIPTMWGTDAVHGHNNVIGATLFPHNIGLGAANNPELIEKIANVTATEVMVTGIDWVFAPTVAAARDDRWGRAYESYSEDPAIVKAYASAIVHGLQGHAGDDFLSDNRVISTVKHFIGDGGTDKGDDQGDVLDTEQALFDIHAQGYVGGLSAGAQSVMASFNSWHGEKLHGKKYLLTDVLKNKMGFDGFVVGDWNGHGQVKGCSNESCAQAINAGLDIFMAPTPTWKPLFNNTIAQVQEGIIPMSRIDDAVSRILRVKVRAGLFDKPSPAQRKFSGKTELIGQASHRDIAKQAVRESLVLLKNNNVLPISPKSSILVAGDAAHNIGKQSGGWTITWQGTNNSNEDFPGGSSIYDGIAAQVTAAGGKVILSESGEYSEKPDVAIVVFGEEPYAEGHGDRDNLDYQRGSKTDLALLARLKEAGIPVVSVFISGRPMWVNAEINTSDAFVAAWLPGSEGSAVADVLLTDAQNDVQHDFKGKLSFSWPNTPYQAVLNVGDEDYAPMLPYGFGLDYASGTADNLQSAPKASDGVYAQVSAGTLVETYESPNKGQTERVIFNGAVQKPWVMALQSQGKRAAVISSTQSLGNLSYRTIDKYVQEDAFRLVSSAGTVNELVIASKGHFREDLSAQLLDDSVLAITFARQSSVSAPIMLGMSCESEGDTPGSCSYQLDITEQVKQAELGQWTTLNIDLACYIDKGIKFSGMVMPFQLLMHGDLSLDISEIKFALADDASTLSCTH